MILLLTEELQIYCEGQNVSEIRRLVDVIRQQSDVARFLENELTDATELVQTLDPSPARRVQMALKKLDKNAVQEIKRGNHPSPIVQRVMTAVFLLLGEKEDNVTVSNVFGCGK